MTNQIKYIRKAQQMQITKPQIQLQITKTELNQLIADALTNPESAAAIKRVLNPQLAEAFPQFPEFTNITLGETDESGATMVILKQPREAAPTGPIKSLEPEVIDEPVADEVEEPSEEPTPTNEYIEPDSE